MHQFGAGLPQDLALAKRYYDKASELQPDAWLPVSLALYGLGLHTWCVPGVD
jgi:SEL1 protein